jgi:periplasmic divalent cation tolerance protein
MHPQIVLITAPAMEEAERIAQTLVEERLAACANLLPGITSIYRWEGRVERDFEMLLIVKTTDDCLPALIRRVRELHSYEVPEILAVPVTGGSPEYLAWLLSSVDSGAQMNKT